jgi:purine-binding chemotaxis protein CheW
MTVAATSSGRPDQMLEFTLGDETYCVGIDAVDEIVKPDEITALPESPPALAGVMDLRGEMTVIVKPKQVFDLAGGTDTSQVIIFESDRDDQVGWLVDRVHRVRDTADASIDPVDDNQYVDGLLSDGDQFTVWVDAGAVNATVNV